MSSQEALEVILGGLKDNHVSIFTTGFISRRAFSIRDRALNFYMLGSMGLVSAVGLGLALNSKKRVLAFDGDGSILMDLGAMAMIAHAQPKNLVHFVLDNGVYESTGNQPTASRVADLAGMARAAGYKKVFRFHSLRGLKKRCPEILNDLQGPLFVLLKVKNTKGNIGTRVSLEPTEIKQRFRVALRKN